MKATVSVAVAALLTATLNVVCIEQASAQTFADSTGGSSQSHGELVTTPSGIVPFSVSNHAARASQDAATSGEGRFQAYADSTGGSSTARAEFLLDHARPARADQLAARGRYQPYLDSTGGNSEASAERALEEAGADASLPGVGLASTKARDRAVR